MTVDELKVVGYSVYSGLPRSVLIYLGTVVFLSLTYRVPANLWSSACWCLVAMSASTQHLIVLGHGNYQRVVVADITMGATFGSGISKNRYRKCRSKVANLGRGWEGFSYNSFH